MTRPEKAILGSGTKSLSTTTMTTMPSWGSSGLPCSETERPLPGLVQTYHWLTSCAAATAAISNTWPCPMGSAPKSWPSAIKKWQPVPWAVELTPWVIRSPIAATRAGPGDHHRHDQHTGHPRGNGKSGGEFERRIKAGHGVKDPMAAPYFASLEIAMMLSTTNSL